MPYSMIECFSCHKMFEPDPATMKFFAEDSGGHFDPTDFECEDCRRAGLSLRNGAAHATGGSEMNDEDTAVALWKSYYRDWINGYHPAHKDMRRLRREAALERRLAAAQRMIEAAREASYELGSTLRFTRIGWDDTVTCYGVLEPINKIAFKISKALGID